MEDLGIAITYHQIVVMGKEKLVYMILNLKNYFLAIEACKILKLANGNEMLSQIFIDWAITAIDKEKQSGKQAELADRIYERFYQLQLEKGRKSLTQT